jgi:hypothetical protein
MEGLVSEGGRWLIAQGVLGVVLGISLAVNWILKKELTDCWGNRHADVKAFGEIVAQNTVAIAEMNSASAARTRAVEAMAEASKLAAAEQARLVQEISWLRQQIGGYRGGAG